MTILCKKIVAVSSEKIQKPSDYQDLIDLWLIASDN